MQQRHEAAPIGLADLIFWVRKNWLLIFVPAAAFQVLGIVYLLIAAPQYRSEALLAPAEQADANQMLSGLASQFGAAGLLGLGRQDNGNLSETALAVLESRRFIGKFIERHGMLPVLFSSRWDTERSAWLDDGEPPPSLNDGHRLLTDILSVQQDDVTGFVSVALEWKDRVVARQWLADLIAELNEDIRQQERAEASQSLEFLTNELARTELNELRQGLYQLSLKELQRLTLANVREEFALKIIDPPSLPDEDDPSSPKKLLVLVGSLVLGVIAGLSLALLVTAWRVSRRESD